MNTDGNTAALDRYLAERESHDNCSMCGRPINGEPDMDGRVLIRAADMMTEEVVTIDMTPKQARLFAAGLAAAADRAEGKQ